MECLHDCVWLHLAVVTTSILYIPIRFRRRGDRESVQTHGNARLEIPWNAVPILLVSLLFIASVSGVNAQKRSAPDMTHVGSRKMLAAERFGKYAELAPSAEHYHAEFASSSARAI